MEEVRFVGLTDAPWSGKDCLLRVSPWMQGKGSRVRNGIDERINEIEMDRPLANNSVTTPRELMALDRSRLEP